MNEYDPSVELNSRGLLCSPSFVERCDLVRTADSSAFSLTDVYERKCDQYNQYIHHNLEYLDDECDDDGDDGDTTSTPTSLSLTRSFKKTLSFRFSLFSKNDDQQEVKKKKDAANYKDTVKKLASHVFQCTKKALAIPAVILFDMVGNIVG